MWVVKFVLSHTVALLPGALGVALLVVGAVEGSLVGLMMLMTGVVLTLLGIAHVLDLNGRHGHQA